MRDRLVAGRYQLVESLGAGGMGEVWLANDLELGRQVALKRSQNGDHGQIRREARIGAGLQHPNVITVFDAVLDDDARWLVMEYLPSRSLADILETDGVLPADEVARIGAQVADALAAMHARNMVHRDIKPGNVLVGDNGRVKLTDLGIARWSEVTLTGAGWECGTPGYLAPEVAGGHEAGPASDVFSLGATLFAAVEGVSPWNGSEGPYVQMRRAAKFDLRQARKAGALAPVLDELMRREPSDRPTAAQAKRLLAGEKIRPIRRVQLSRRAIAFGAAGAVLAIAAALIVTFDKPPQVTPTSNTIGDARTADPCALLDPEWLRQFGRVEYERGLGNFNTCDLLVRPSDNPADVVDVRMEIRSTESPPPEPPVAGRLTMPDRPAAENGKCHRVFALPDGNEAVVTVEHLNDWPANLCGMADQTAKNVLAILNSGQIPRRTTPFQSKSLAVINACGLLTAAEATAALGGLARGPEPAFAGWECYWYYGPRELAVLYAREKVIVGKDDGRLVRAGNHDIYVRPGKGSWEQSCRAEIKHQRFTHAQEDRVEVVEIYLSDGNVKPTELCDAATELGKAAASRLPPP